MTSHFISYFARRADSILHQSTLPANQSSSVGASPSPSASLTASASSSSRSREQDDASSMGAGKEKGKGKEVGSGESVEGCTFCDIISRTAEAFIVYEDENTLAFLDILPIRPGHLLVIPKKHYARVSHLPDEVSASLGRALPCISRALCAATDQPDFNIVSNQGYAQIVHHVHFHLVPAPTANTPLRSGWASVLFTRDELDEDEGKELAEKIRREVARERRERGEAGGEGGTGGKSKL